MTIPARVVVFPGQGAQRPGMARDFCQAFTVAAAAFEEASDALGIDVEQLCSRDDPRLQLTEFTQPAILTAEIAMLRALQADLGLSPTHFGGHSLGEYTALVAAGVLPLSEAASLVRERGRLMQEAVPPGRGGMMSVTRRDIDVESVHRYCEGLTVDVASLNAPGQVVLAGLVSDLDVALDRLRRDSRMAGVQCRRLAVSAPFHSRLMTAVEPGFRSLLEVTSPRWEAGRATSVVANLTGGFHSGGRDALVDALARHVCNRVRWSDDMRALVALDPEWVVEVGPSSILRGFFALLRVDVEAVTTVAGGRHSLEHLRRRRCAA